MSTQRRVLRARLVFPVAGPPISDGTLVIEHGRVVSVGRYAGESGVRDLGHVAVLPGLVNPHTHLEFSDLKRPLGIPGMPFADWIGAVVAWRREQESAGGGDPAWKQRACRAGLEQSAAAGVVAAGEIATAEPAAPVAGRGLPTVIAFRELLGLDPEKIHDLVASAEAHLRPCGKAAGSVRAALSPHAPYTVHPELLSRLVRLSRDRRVPLAMHVAESREELQLLDSAQGALVDRLRQLDAWHDVIPRGTRAADILRVLRGSHRALVIHGNYLDPGGIEVLAADRKRFAVVYCPRTHAYFDHAPYPMADLLRAGIRVTLGTDSRATNPDLQLWDELRTVFLQSGPAGPEQILRMATADAAWALGLEYQLGTLEPGKQAALTIVPLPDDIRGPAHEVLLNAAGPDPAWRLDQPDG